jgi:hypothetical protein
MTTMGMTNTHDKYRRDHIASAPVYTRPIHAHPLRRALVRVLAMIGLGTRNAAKKDDDDEALGIG